MYVVHHREVPVYRTPDLIVARRFMFHLPLDSECFGEGEVDDRGKPVCYSVKRHAAAVRDVKDRGRFLDLWGKKKQKPHPQSLAAAAE